MHYKKTKLTHGSGINDADYVTQKCETVNGKKKQVWICPFYRAWRDMLKRCYNPKYQERRPTYIDCSVCEEWLTFSNFRAWMEKQVWQDKELDKDILTPGNKIYSPDTCVFVTRQLNSFLIDRAAGRGPFLIGVCWDKRDNKFQSKCCNPFTGKQECLGYFSDEQEAHQAWRKRKHKHALTYADIQYDERIANALKTRFIENNLN